MRRFPTGLNPVQVNDIVFSLHATLATAVTITQCFLYEVSNCVRNIIALFSIKKRKLLGITCNRMNSTLRRVIPVCVCKLEAWDGSQLHNSYNIKDVYS